MPQDNSLRSVVYRSFVTCDDPKGMVECGTIRRSKSRSEKMMEHNKNRSKLCVARKAKREETVSKLAIEELHSSSSCQLLEVSRGAHKLNQVIDSWSEGLWCDGHSKDIAKDLLKGALDLQDSLHMLGKLQEASHYMARLKKKEKEKCDKLRNDRVVQRTNSCPTGERNPRLSADSSSKDCIEELRKVIRDSLARQNLLPNNNAEEKRCFSRRYHDSASDIPSTSSSQSSTAQTENFTAMDSSISSASLERKPRGPSLIAKLMGLEEMPSKPLQTNSLKELESKKIFSQQRPIFEIDMPKVRKSQFLFPKEDPKTRTLEDILETMHFKGLLKSNSIKEIKPDSHQSRDFFLEHKLINCKPPIVLIKPRHDLHFQPQEKFEPVFQEERTLNTETVLKKVKAKEEPPSKTVDSKNRGLNFNEMRRVEAEETPIKRLSHPDNAKDSEKKEARPVKKETRIKQRLSTKVKSLGPVTQPVLNKEATDKKFDKKPKPAISNRKPVEKEVAKANSLSRSKGQATVAPPKSSKPENGTNVTKNKIARQQSTTAKFKSNCKPPTVVRSHSDQKSPTKRENAVSKATAAKITTGKLESKGDDIVLEAKKIDRTYENDTVLERKMIDLASENDTSSEGKRIDLASENETFLEGYSNQIADQLPKKEGTEQTDIQTGEHCDNSESSVCDVTLVTTDDQNNRCSGEVDDDPIIPIGNNSESFLKGTSLKALLLSSSAFLNHAEELFHLHGNVPTISQKFGISDFTNANTRLSLDCANEIVRRISSPDSQMVHPPLLTLVGNNKRHISLNHLLKETCDGVEALRCYSELAGENYPTDSLYAILERDIKCSEVLTGIWDLGWKKGFSMDDTMQIVDDIEKQLLNGLIEEICA
ncbi:hypothetical protein PTKIN_Ptkin19aG0060100 [Pterospermum kingtungense]